MARRSRTKASRLVKYAGRVVTVAQATACVSKGFKGCSKAEIRAVMKMLNRLANSKLR